MKPIDRELILEAAHRTRLVVTVEEHSLIGGLGSAVLEALADAGQTLPRIKRLGIGDRFADHYGSQNKLMDVWGLTVAGIIRTVKTELEAARQ